MQCLHQGKRFGIGAQQQVLAVVDRAHLCVIDAPSSTACNGGRFKDGDLNP